MVRALADHSIFRASSDAAVRESNRFRDSLKVRIAGIELDREVEIELGEPQTREYGVVIPVRWKAADAAGLFPSIEAVIEVSPLDDDLPLTQLSLIGEYKPPLGVVGTIGNAILGHRLAEAAVRSFVTELARRIEER